jgi:predicted CopG family antitoxin
MSQKNKRYIVISKENYDSLRGLGTITDSFDSVISQLLKTKKEFESTR